MKYLFHNITLFIIGFLSVCLIVIGYLLLAVLFPIPDMDLLSRSQVLQLQKEFALNYPLGTNLFYLGICLMGLVMVLLIGKFINKKWVPKS